MTFRNRIKFHSRIEITVGCWLWKDSGYNTGYGAFYGKHAHRVAWELEYGSIPKGLHVCHKCDNPRCVRPSHLFLGTHRDNMHDHSIKYREQKARNKPFSTEMSGKEFSAYFRYTH